MVGAVCGTRGYTVYAASNGVARRGGGASRRWCNILAVAQGTDLPVIASMKGYIGVVWQERPVMSHCTPCRYENSRG